MMPATPNEFVIDPTRLAAAARRVVDFVDGVLAAYEANNYFAVLPHEQIEPIDFRRALRKRTAAVMILNAIENGREPAPVDLGQLLRDDGWSVRDLMLAAMT
jgi:hypothetical protein